MSCPQAQRLYDHVLGALPSGEALALEAHVQTCSDCREMLASLNSTVDSFVSWPVDVLRPSPSLWRRLSERIATEAGAAPTRAEPADRARPEWKEVAPGISCKLLAHDTEKHVVSMLVRLAPGVAYPPHRHAGAEELHLLDGELWIDGRKLRPGDHSRAEAGTMDARVRSETGCTCVLITSTRDVLL